MLPFAAAMAQEGLLMLAATTNSRRYRSWRSQKWSWGLLSATCHYGSKDIQDRIISQTNVRPTHAKGMANINKRKNKELFAPQLFTLSLCLQLFQPVTVDRIARWSSCGRTSPRLQPHWWRGVANFLGIQEATKRHTRRRDCPSASSSGTWSMNL